MKELIVFYDGPCVLCNSIILKLCKWDKNDNIRFTNLDSDYAKSFFKNNPSSILDCDSIISWDSEKQYCSEAKAVFRVLKYLNGFWKLFLIFNLLPTSFLNMIYRFIAKNRYNWFGKYNVCPLPEKKYTHKFL